MSIHRPCSRKSHRSRSRVSTSQPIDNTRQKFPSSRGETSPSWDLKRDVRTEGSKYRSYKDVISYEGVLERGRDSSIKNERCHERRNMSRKRHDWDYFSIEAITSNGLASLPEEDTLDTIIAYDRFAYEGFNDKGIVRTTGVYSHLTSDHFDCGNTRSCVDRRETRLIYDYESSRSQQLELQLNEAQDALRAAMRRTELLSNSLLETQAELTRVYEQRDSYINDVHNLRGELDQMEAQLEEVETRNYALTKDYETLERDNACLRRYSDELNEKLQGTHSQKDRRDLHHIRRRILVDKAIEALKRQYCDLYPLGPNESFYSWSKRVGYPGWERVSSMVMDAKYHGNKCAHQATRAEMLQTVTLAIKDDLESGDTGEGEILRDMYNIVYRGKHNG